MHISLIFAATNYCIAMAKNDYVMVSPLVSHYPDWAKGQFIEVEDNPYRGTVIVVKMENGDIFWDVEYHFKKIA